MSPDDGIVVQLPSHLTAVEALFARPPGERWDVDGLPISIERWLVLVADADYRVLVATRLGPELTGGQRITVRTEWAGEDLRLDPAPDRRPLIWRTDVIGGPLDGRSWLAARRHTAHMLHDHAIGEVTQALTGRS